MSISTADNRNSTKVSKASTYLSGEENDLVFRLVGRRCISQCTAVAQLYQTESPTHTRWIKRYTGALCFVKDNGKRSYYCRIYCLMRHEMVWEQEMYDTIEINRSKPYLLTFEGQVSLACTVTFNKTTKTDVTNIMSH
jgi:Wiskott-Aldrich syndrome protein